MSGMRIARELRSHLHYKIILPFLLLTLLVASAGSMVSFFLIASSAQERLNNQLAQVARTSSDTLVEQERANLVFLREIAFAGPNERTGAPAVGSALAQHDTHGLGQALDPYFRVGSQRPGVHADRLIAFDTTRHSLIDWELIRDASGTTVRTEHQAHDIGELWFVPQILAGQQDQLGDKFAGLIELPESNTRYLFSVAPIYDGTRIAGGLIIAGRLDSILQALSTSSQAAVVTLYNPEDGSAIASSIAPAAGLAALNMRQALVAPVRNIDLARQQSVFDVVEINQRAYQFAYAPMQIRSATVALVSVGLARDYVTGPLADARQPLALLTIVLMLAIIGLGIFVARQITRPLQELVDTAQAVTSGDLERRSQVTVQDEVGLLSQSFNDMTAHLLELYHAVHAEASQRAAIVESITDGVVVCDPHGTTLVINRAMRRLLRLAEDAPQPQRFEDLPLTPREEPGQGFGDERSADLFELGEHIVRVATAPVLAEDGTLIGDVYVLQDLTSEVAMDQAKTNFIATISHELRTPLTVLGGTTELLLRNILGTLSDDQREVIETMRRHTLAMTALINNVITIAGLEAGSITFKLEAFALRQYLDDLLWPLRAQIAAKGLALRVDVPDDLPYVLADSHQLRSAFQQLIDNARRYTDKGTITIRAQCTGAHLRIDITDTGHGISADLSEQLFTRFTRGSEGINSAERGIGLGLAIARQLIERQGGTLWLDSTSEQGSTFSFTLACTDEGTNYNDGVIATAA
jgi:signal transduction histidine kinase